MGLRSLPFLLAATAVFPGPGAGQDLPSGAPDRVGAVLADSVEALLEAHRVPGAAVAFVSDSISFVQGYGTAHARSSRPVSPETVFEAASLGKPVFALAVLRLARSGHLDLDAPLGESGVAARITARQALEHSSGLPNWSRDGPAGLDTPPGSTWSYSGLGYVLLQHALEERMGRPLQEIVDSLVFSPLGMTASSYTWRSGYEGTAARGHDARGRPAEKWRPDAEEAGRVGAASSLHTSARDLGRFLQAMAADEALRDWILRDPMEVSPELGLSWGLGWAVENHPSGREYLFHWGANPAFRSFMLLSADGGLGFVLLTNGANGLELADEVAELLTGRGHPLFEFYMLHPTD